MHSYSFHLGLVMALLWGGHQSAHAQTRSAEQLAAMLAPVIDDQSLILAHFELKNAGLLAAIENPAGLFKMSDQDRTGLKKVQTSWTRSARELAQAGVRDICFMISIHELPAFEPLLIVPLDDKSDVAAIEKALTVAPHYGETGVSSRRYGDVLVFARGVVQDRLAKSRPVARPEVAAAFAAIGGTEAQVIVLPSADARRVIAELLPTLPEILGGGSSQVVTEGVIWAAAGLDLVSGKQALKMVIQAKNAAAAQALNDRLPSMLDAVFRIPDVAELMPNFRNFTSQIKPTVSGDQLVFEQSSMTALTLLLSPPLEAANVQVARSRSMNSLKQIGLAMFNYHDAHKGFPPRVLTSPEGKPLLSWRVQLLPYLDAGELYKEFHLDEPWDSEHNRKLIPRMPTVFTNLFGQAGEGRTCYVAPLSEQGMFRGSRTLDFKEVVDGTSNTILFVEADTEHAVIWTSPNDIEIDAADPARGLVNARLHGFLAGMADGSARFFAESTDKKTLAAYFSATARDVIPRP